MSQQPTTQAEPAPSRYALDPVLAARLWRPVESPGVIDPSLARAMATRHERMVRGLPLAELLARHTGSTQNSADSVPIVYAQLAPPLSTPPLPTPPLSTPHRAPRAAAAGPTSSKPVAEPVAQGLPVAPSPAPGPAVPGVPDVPPMLVGRARADRPTPATLFPSRTPFTPPASHAPAPAVAPVGFPAPAAAPKRTPSLPRVPDTRSTAAGSSATGDPLAVPAHLPGAEGSPIAVHPSPVMGGARPGAAPRSTAPRVVPGQIDQIERPGRRRNSGDLTFVVAAGQFRNQRLPAWSQPRPGSGPTARVVAETPRPPARSGEPLTLVDLGTETSHLGGQSATGRGRRAPAAGRAPVGGQVTTGGGGAAGSPGWKGGLVPAALGEAASPDGAGSPGAGRTARADRPEPAPLDVEHIVDAVHRRFVRRLAIEAERRAVR